MMMVYSRVRIKICGMTRATDIHYATALGADAVGLIFYKNSARYVTIERAKKIVHGVPPFVSIVGVFVNPEVSFVNRVISELPIGCLQFHGDESPIFCEQFTKPYIKAIAATTTDMIVKKAKEHQNAVAILLDSPSEASRGGTGEVFDWNIIPKQLGKPIILAGGLHATNVKTAIETYAPYAVDVCSGVESQAGEKDYQKMRQFIGAINSKVNDEQI